MCTTPCTGLKKSTNEQKRFIAGTKEKQENMAREDQKGRKQQKRTGCPPNRCRVISLFSQSFQQENQQCETIKTMKEKSRGRRCFFMKGRWRNISAKRRTARLAYTC
jgi:hypothetical protein